MTEPVNPQTESLTEGQKIKELVDDARRYRRDYDKAMIDERQFALKLKHYQDDVGETRDRRRIQPKGRELVGKLRHKVASICEHLFFTVRPVDDQSDPQMVDIVERVMNSQLHDPMINYAQAREDMVMMAISGRLGVIALDFVPGIGAFDGEIIPRVVDPAGRFYWTPGWKSPHDPTCPWVAEIKEMRVEDVRRMKRLARWKNTDCVKADAGYTESATGNDPTLAPGTTRLPANSQGNPGAGISAAEPRCTIIHFYQRFTDKVVLSPKKELRALRPEAFYLRCASCGYENREHPGASLPPSGTLPCPQCASVASQFGPDVKPEMITTLDRVEKEMDTEETLAYPKGREMIIAPFSDCAVLFEGQWRKIRSVPYIVFDCYSVPGEPIGMSDTAYDWSLQLIADALMRQAYEQMSENRDLIIAPEDGLVDAAGEPWQFADSQGRIAYWTGQGNPQVQHFQGTGIPPGWREIFGQVQGVLMRDMGTSDISMGPEQSRDIAVGTIRAMQETGEIPTDHHIRKLHRAESIGFGVWLDLIRECWSEKRLVRMSPKDGSFVFQSLKGMDIPNADVVVTAEPRITDVDQQEVEALIKVLNSPPPLMKILAKKYGLSPIEIQNYIKEMEQLQQQNKPQPPPASPDAILNAMAATMRAQPGFIAYEQIQQALAIAGIQPMQEPDEHGMILLEKQARDALHPPVEPGTEGPPSNRPKGKFQGGK